MVPSRPILWSLHPCQYVPLPGATSWRGWPQLQVDRKKTNGGVLPFINTDFLPPNYIFVCVIMAILSAKFDVNGLTEKVCFLALLIKK